MRRRLGAGALALALAGAAFAFAQGGPPAEPGPLVTRPEVPGAARTLVPFGIEATADGPRAWALGRSGDTTVVLRRGVAGGWTAAPLGAGPPVGDKAPQHAGELTADGYGAVLLAGAGLFTRAPGDAFAAAPDPGAALLGDEQLVADPNAATARTLLAVTGGDDPATFVAPTIADGTARAVLRLDGGGWQREAIGTADPFRPVGLAAAGTQAWLLGTAGGKVILLRRDAGTWVPAAAAESLIGGALPVEVAAPPADPLTATADGLWIDLRVTTTGATAPVDVTEHLKLSEPEAAPSPTATATAAATDTATPTATATPSPSATPTAPQLAVDGRWCDVTALCDHPLGFTFNRGDRGYRSVATAATAEAKYGTRQISAPVDQGVAADARAPDAERQGGYAALEGERFVLRDGIGEDGSSTTQAIAFAADGTGFTGGTIAFGAVSRTAFTPPPEESLPLQSDALVGGALAPNGDGRILAMSRMSGIALYTPGSGWSYANTTLLELAANGRYASPRVIVWPRPNLIIAGGAAGQLGTVEEDPVALDLGFEGAFVMPQKVHSFQALPVEATIIAIACTPTDPLDCLAVGRNGLIVRGDGTNWRIQSLPRSAPERTDITGVAFDDHTPLLATTDGLYRGDGDDYKRDDDLRARMTAAGLSAAVTKVATVAGGGVTVDGRFARDSATAPWRASGAPLELHPYALAAYRDANGNVRAIVSATPEETPLPEPVESDDGRNPSEDEPPQPTGLVPLAPSPVGAVVLRETADGWVDLDRSSFQRSGGRDLPDMTVNTREILVDANGSGVLLGGVSDPSPAQFYLGGPDQATLGAASSVRRLDHGQLAAPAPTPAPEIAEIPPRPGAVRLAIGGHPACLDRCSGAAGQGYAPDTHLRYAVARVKAMTGAGAGPAALLIGGGRASKGGDPLDLGGARRYRELTEGAGVPTYVLPGPGDVVGGGAAAFGAAFSSAPAPQGTGEAPPGIQPAPIAQPEGAFAFDVRTVTGAVRVIAIDNAAGRLAGGVDGEQAKWIGLLLDDARATGIPSIAVGSVPLDASQSMKPAEDAADEIALLAGRASAYVATAGEDDPDAENFGGVLSQSVAGSLTLLQSSTLGYAPAQSFVSGEFEDDLENVARQTSAALLMLDVQVDQIDPATGIAPVSALAEPLLDGLFLDQASRNVPLGWASQLYVRGDALSPQRFLMSPKSPDGEPRPASPSQGSNLLSDICRFFLSECSTAVPTDMTFASSNPQIARFVAVRRGGSENRGRPEVVLDSTGHVVDDPRGFLCPLALGSVDVSVTALGRRVSTPVRVVPAPKLAGGEIRTDPIPEGTCAFPSFTRADDEPKPTPTPEAPATTPPTSAPETAPAPQPQPQPHAPKPHPHPQPQPVPAAPIPVLPALAPAAPPEPATPPVADSARPPVAPAPKPPVPPAPPAPPQGLSVQQAPAPQVQISQAMQPAEQRREEYAFESDNAAVAYAHGPSPLPWEIAGGVALLVLVMAGGTLAGRARARSVVPARNAAG